MERILTFAEFAKSFDQKGEALGNSEQDVKTLQAATDQFTAPTQEEGCGDNAGGEGIAAITVAKTEPEVIIANDAAPEQDEMPAEEEVMGDNVGDGSEAGSEEPAEEEEEGTEETDKNPLANVLGNE